MFEHAYTAGAFRSAGAPRREREQRHDIVAALCVAALCVAALALVWTLASQVPAFEWRDALVLHDFTQLSGPTLDSVGLFTLHLLDPLEFVLWGVALVALALARARPRVALAVVAVMTLAPFTSEKLKPLVAHPHIRIGLVSIGPASWPSGHATAAAAFALSAVLVAPPRRRPLVALIGAAFVLVVGAFLLILAWHMPSDVLGGYLVAAGWTALAVAVLRACEHAWPTRPRREGKPAGAL